MAAVSAWAKPGAWALESEESEALEQKEKEKGYSSSDSHQSNDFPSLSLAAVTKIPKTKKKKKQTLSLAEFTTGASVAPGSGKFQPSSKTLAHDEMLLLPTGPRERSAEELDRSRGFGYGGARGGGRGSSGEDSANRWGSSRGSDDSRRGAREPREPRDSGPSRADEVDDWGAGKKPVGGFERRERERGFFSDSQSRADDSDSWVSKQGSAPPMSEPRRERRGFDFDKERLNGGRVDADNWGKRREESGGGGRPRIVLQPRTLPIANENNGEEKKVAEVKSKGANPFGNARPREEVLKEKGQDWKEIDEKLESVKIQESVPPVGRKGFGMGNGSKEDRTERAWRKLETNDATPPPTPPPRDDSVEEQLPEN